MTQNRSLLGPTIGTLVFVLCVPGTVIVLVPYLLSGWRFGAPLLGSEAGRWFGVVLMLGGLPIFVDFVSRFVREGRGTPAPVAPTQYLVVGGAFRYVRNPGYVAVLALLVGQALLFGNAAILLYAAIVGLAFHLFVIGYEEPTLRRQFGTQYDEYCRQVPRWVPRFRSKP